MARKLFGVCIVVLILVSCSKDKKSDLPAHVTAKVDGIAKEFNLSITAHKTDAGKGITLAAFSGYGALPYPSLSMYVEDNTVISPKAYNADDLKVAVGYATGVNEAYASNEDFVITITSISDADVKGTFSGKVEDGTTTINITEGSFYAKFE